MRRILGWARFQNARLLALVPLWLISLWAIFSFGPARHFNAAELVNFAGRWLQETIWAWPLAVTVALTMLTGRRAGHLWPERNLRIRLGLVSVAALVGLTGLTMTAGPWTMLLMLGVASLVGLLATWLLVVPARLAPPLSAAQLDSLSNFERLEATNARLKLQDDLRTTALQAIAGLAVLIGAFLTFQQLTEDRHQAAADRELARQGQASERFTRAISQLSSDRAEVQLGGIFGLEQIAQQAPDNRVAVSNVLVVYLHRRVPRPSDPVPQPADLRVRAPDIQAALLVLGRRQTAKEDPSLDLRALDLRNADLLDAKLSLASLRGSDLRGADFFSADLSHADLSDADLRGANLSQTNLIGADLRGADLRRANLVFADLGEAKLGQANLRNANADARTRWPAGFDWRRAGISMTP